MTVSSGENLDSNYELAIEYLNQQYENYFPTSDDITLSEAELSEMAYYEALGRYCADPDSPSK
jgi:hypothetical protein